MAFAASEPEARVEPRPLRADARRNRERILEAARTVFADHGHEAAMDEIARRAEVGMGTVYRHFPTKEALTGALVADCFVKIGAQVEAALAATETASTPEAIWETFSGVLWFGAELLASNRGLTEAMGVMDSEDPRPAAVDMRRAQEALEAVIARAQGAGVLRADLCVDDIPMLMCGVGAATHKPHHCAESWRRHLAIVLDGLRVQPIATKLPDCRHDSA